MPSNFSLTEKVSIARGERCGRVVDEEAAGLEEGGDGAVVREAVLRVRLVDHLPDAGGTPLPSTWGVSRPLVSNNTGHQAQPSLSVHKKN